MKKIFRPLLLIVLFLTVFFAAACSENTENEHLPEYCQTYAGFTSIASKDFYDLLREQSDIEVNRLEYIEAISQISLEFNVDDPSKEIDLSGIQCFQNLTDLTLVGRSFKDLSPISALNNIQSIELRGTSVVSIDSFKNLSKIKSLKISETRTLQSVSGIEEMTKLTDLDLSSNGIVVIDGLNNLENLETLYLNDNEIISFPSINRLELLVSLDISDNNINQLGEDLSGLSMLSTLNAQNNEICDISALDDLISLEILNLSNNDLGCGGIGVSPDFDSLENAPNLKELYLDNNNLTSIEGLRDRDINLEILHINDNNLTDITPISEYTGITELVLFNNNITDIDDLSGMTGLSNIDLSNNNIDDFSDLLSIPNLVDVDLSFNNITVIPDISGSWTSLSILNLSSNMLIDTSGVNGHPTLESLIIYNNGLTELNGISNLPELEILEIFNEELEAELEVADVNPNQISIIRDSFNYLESLPLQTGNEFEFGFDLSGNIEIYSSINGLTDIDTIDFTEMNIDIIDDDSINLPNLRVLRVGENNITSINFILGNPLLERLYINDNSIDNLQLISGVGTSELDNLEHVVASNITSDNVLNNAFIQLPNLSTIDLTDTSIVSVSNSFNDLESLTEINIDADSLVTITDSFNNIFSTYDTTNRFVFNSGMIGVISNSFNDGIYDRIAIVNQTTTEATTVIQDSFNDIDVRDPQGIVISDSDFATIDNSFNGTTTDDLSLSSNKTTTITDSLIASTVNDTLDLSDNLLETVLSLNLLTSVDTVNLSENMLNTLSFIENIPNITSLDVSTQRNELTASYTLAGIDGINNMETLTTLIIGDIGVTSIDGMRNLGISSFEFSYSDNNDITINTISATSFTGTPLTTLDLDEYQLNDITFIDNLDVLENLYIGVDLSDLSDFETQDFESTLEVLSILNAQNTLSFSHLSNYDVLTSLTFSSPLTTTISDLDGLDSLVSLALDFDQITEINDSYNELEDLIITTDYLQAFDVLTTITNSFDMYGDATHDGIAYVSANVSITDSFNNLNTLFIEENDGETLPNFDLLSFDNIETINFEYGSYSSFAFLNGYSALSNVVVGDLGIEITDLVNNNIQILEVESSDITIDTFTLDLNDEAIFMLVSLRNGLITMNGDFREYNINASNADVIINSTATSQTLQANVVDLTLNGNSVDSVDLSSYTSTNTTFNTNALTEISRVTTFEDNATTFTVNSLEEVLNISTKSDDLIINDDNATTYSVIATSGAVTLNNSVANISVSIDANELYVAYDSLENITILGESTIINIDSSNLDTVTTNTSVITTLNIDSEQPILNIDGSGITNTFITNNMLNDLTANVNSSELTITSTNNENLNAVITANEVNVDADNIPSILFADTTSITTLNANSNNSLHTITYGTATISMIKLTTQEPAVTIAGSTSQMEVNAPLMNTLNIDAPLSTVEVLFVASTLSVDLDIGNILFDGTTLDTLNMSGTSSIDLLRIVNSTNFNTLDTNDSTINTLFVDTDATSLDIDAVNSESNTIEGSLFTSIKTDVGTNPLNIESTNTANLDVEINAGFLLVITNTANLTIDDLSTISDLRAVGTALETLNTGTSVITTIFIQNSSGDLDIIGLGIVAITISSHDIQTLDVTASTSTSLVVSSTDISGLTVATNTSSLGLTAIGNSTISSDNLESVTYDVGTNDLTMTLDKTNLDLTLLGVSGKTTISGTDLDSIIVSGGTDIATLELINIDIDELDISGSSIDELDITTLLTSINITGGNVQSVILDGVNLTTVDLTSTFTASTTEITTSQTILDLNSNINSVTLTNNNLTILDVAGLTTNSLTLQANSLASLNTSTNITDFIDITTNQSTFNLNTSAITTNYAGSTIGTLNFTNTNATLTVLDTNTKTLNVDSISSSLSIDGANLTHINGDLNNANLSDTTGILTFDVSATGTIQIVSYTVDELIFTGVNTINELDIKSTSADTVNTNTVDITTLKYEAVDNDTTITTETDTIELSTEANAIITLDYTGSTQLVLQTEVLNWLIVNLITASELDIEGQSNSITISGVNLDSVTTIDLTINDKLTMNDTLIIDLDFLWTEQIINLNTIEMNTLSNTRTAAILAIIDNTAVNLISPMVDADFLTHYYDEQIAQLTFNESQDNIKYNGFRSTAIDNAWTEILTNEYMDHLVELDTKAEIDAQVYQTAEDYFASYISDAGLTEGDFTPSERQDVIDAIQATLDDPLLTILEVTLQNQVTASIDADATANAISQQENETFTIS